MYQARKFCRTFKDCQNFKNRNAKYGLLPAKDAEILTPHHTVCVDIILTHTILAKIRDPENRIPTKELKLLCINFINPETG